MDKKLKIHFGMSKSHDNALHSGRNKFHNDFNNIENRIPSSKQRIFLKQDNSNIKPNNRYNQSNFNEFKIFPMVNQNNISNGMENNIYIREEKKEIFNNNNLRYNSNDEKIQNHNNNGKTRPKSNNGKIRHHKNNINNFRSKDFSSNLNLLKINKKANLNINENNVLFGLNNKSDKNPKILIDNFHNEFEDFKLINKQFLINNSKSHNEQKDSEINNLEKKIKYLKEIIKKYQDENSTLKEKNFKNLEKLKYKEEKLNKIDNINTENKLLKEKIEKLEKENKEMKEKEEKKGKNKEKRYFLLKKENEKDSKKDNNEKMEIENEVDIKSINLNENEINNNIEKNNELEKEINEYKEKKKEVEIKLEELNKRFDEIKEKENEFNNKISFYEDKEKYLEKESEKIENMRVQYNNIKQENKILIKNKEELEKEIDELKIKYKKELNNNPLKIYKKPTLIGLNNIGATCFMNATLQCLSQTEGLTSFFLKDTNKEKILNNNIAIKNKNENQISPCFLELIHKLWEINGKNSFSPNNFMNIINEMNPLFKKGQAGDSKDFIIFVLEQLHKELKQSLKNININNIKNNESLNQYDQENAFNYFISDFQENCSIISDVFFGITETTNECFNCKNNYNSHNMNNPICYNYQIFNCLIFPLEEIRKMKNISSQNINYINNNIVTLIDCFTYNQKSEIFTGQNQNYCNVCKQLNDSIYSSKIYSSPTVLILILNRGKGNIFDIKLNFSEVIDLTQFILRKDMPLLIYSLYGVITHIGQSGPSAHFVASCKSPIDNKWYRYNDAIVNPINNIQKEVIDFGTPYILFYRKNKII